MKPFLKNVPTGAWLALACLITAVVYSSGLTGSWLFDDYPNIVDNTALHISHFSIPDLVGAALSSPSTEFKRPLSSITFALNILLTGADPFWMKLTNLVIHLINGMLVFVLSRLLLTDVRPVGKPPAEKRTIDFTALLIAAGWMLLPINLTAVLYTVQRMESLANIFVLIGLIGYFRGRKRMLAGQRRLGLTQAIGSVVINTALGLTAKETAIMLPLYAFLIEWVSFGGRGKDGKPDRAIYLLFTLSLILPMIAGIMWQLPKVLNPSDWAGRDFTLGQRLLTESRVIVNYIGWTLFPTPHALSFYHDDIAISTGLLSPWTTLASILVLIGIVAAIIATRHRKPLIALGLALFLGCHLLTGTILPLELTYEHRNYFASMGLLIALIPLATDLGASMASTEGLPILRTARTVLLAALMLLWSGLTATTAFAWGNPLRLAQTLALRAPDSPRAQYALGRMYVIYSNYDPHSVFTQMAYAPLERAMRLPNSSILPEQALIFFNARLHRPLDAHWWDAMITHLKARRPGVQDESSLAALTKCAYDGLCNLPENRMLEAFLAALSHPQPSARLLSIYSDYAWNVLRDQDLGERMAVEAVKTAPSEPAYRVTLIRMLVVQGQYVTAHQELKQLESLNIGGRLDATISDLRGYFPSH